MKIETKYKIEEAASDDPKRYAINGVHVANVDGSAKAVATNGRILAMVPVEIEEGDKVDVNVKREAFTAARKVGKALKNPAALIELNGRATVKEPGGDRSFDYIEDRFPNFLQVLPKAAEKTVKITLDIKLLTKLWKALGGEAMKTDGITLTIGCDKDGADIYRPVEVKTLGGVGYGIIMQMRTE